MEFSCYIEYTFARCIVRFYNRVIDKSLVIGNDSTLNLRDRSRPLYGILACLVNRAVDQYPTTSSDRNAYPIKKWKITRRGGCSSDLQNLGQQTYGASVHATKALKSTRQTMHQVRNLRGLELATMRKRAKTSNQLADVREDSWSTVSEMNVANVGTDQGSEEKWRSIVIGGDGADFLSQASNRVPMSLKLSKKLQKSYDQAKTALILYTLVLISQISCQI
ncbi:hypothetical protein BDN70DRAFT_947521 [Pholiota conissans]|uniref:Uncharacterized protein n=1 Tax=Pholiota conissans TaxID=109636 RepID=A0A9P5YYC3_9AGAR|nr:hypothetical protein BDN70DRAFT_947521 [Pholiota conissans]